MLPRIEQWVMEMQDVDYELVYEPGKVDEAPTTWTGDDSTGNFIRWTVNTEHTVVITMIREEALKDEVIQTIAKRIVKGDWEKHKREKDLEPYLHVRQELSNFQRTAYSATSNPTEES